LADEEDVRVKILTISLLLSITIGGSANAARSNTAISGTPFVLTTPDGPVPAPIVDATVRGLSAFQRYTRLHLGVALAKPTTVRMLRTDRCVANQGPLPALQDGAVTDHGNICLFTGRSIYPKSEAMRAEVAAHEAAHILQDALGCDRIPLWLTEGMAEDLAWRSARGMRHFDQLLAAGKVSTRYSGLSKHGLRTHELSMRGLSYPEAALAAIMAEGGQPRRFVAFCRTVARGVLWPKAFGSSFGVGINAFYARFADTRHELATE
jgi:hypothetical protein